MKALGSIFFILLCVAYAIKHKMWAGLLGLTIFAGIPMIVSLLILGFLGFAVVAVILKALNK